MFSGIVAYRGWVVANDPAPSGGTRFRIRCDALPRETVEPKDSVAIDGVCLTVTDASGDVVSFDVVPETLERSTLGQRLVGDGVNVEFALRIGDRVGGHFVYGHVDAAVRVLSRSAEGQGERFRFERPAALAFAIVDKAFVAVDGVSLTVAAAGKDWFEIALIPETLARTTLGDRVPGCCVNLEIDPLARYAAASARP
jgi:riboflavin synthase